MATHVINNLAIPVVAIQAPMTGPPKLEHSVDQFLGNQLEYDISLFCLPPPDMYRLALEGGRHLIDAKTYRIGAWPWELPHWPSAFGRLDKFVNEIWAQSEFVATVYKKLGTVPVFNMPMVVSIPKPTLNLRKLLDLPTSSFLFYLLFDGNSWLSRKNPLGGVQAFQKAFPLNLENQNVGLVIKAMNINSDNAMWEKIELLAAKDPRIHIIQKRMERQDLINLMASCDCYISLHRSEGFGRVIAEAMLLGQPVVVTNFSGNVDFCNARTAYLVDGDLDPLSPGEYLFHEGQYWCNPNIDIAAQQLTRVYEDQSERDNISIAGRNFVLEKYSLSAVSRNYLSRLSKIRVEQSL
jgi:glycosyltransferase involved in cell wall biosynthesis